MAERPPIQVPLFVDQPPKERYRAARYNWPGITAILREHPHQWVCVLIQQPTTLADAIRQQKIAALRPSEEGYYEVASRNKHRTGEPDESSMIRWHPSSLADLYMRWVPNTKED